MKLFFLSAAEYITDHELNGEGQIAFNLLNTLCERGHEVVACVQENRISGDAPFEVVELRRSPRFSSLAPIDYARAACAELKRRGPSSFDVAHWLFPDGAYGLFRHQLPVELPFVVGPLVTPWPAKRPWYPPGYLVDRLTRPWLFWCQRLVFGQAAQVIVGYEAVRDRLSRAAARQAVEIPFGIPARPRSGCALPTVPRILFVGRLEVLKGVLDLLDAATCLRKEMLAFELALAGSGSLSDILAELIIQRGLEHHVRVLGRVPPERVFEEMEASSLVCVPAHGEPFGMVLLEAMRAGRAVVATNEGGPRSIVVDGKGGRLVPAKSPAELAVALATLLSNRTALENAGSFNRERFEQRYALDSVAERLEMTYRAVSNKA
jgi:glycosyltransferase involved in cell wall biosynthesis